MFKKLLLAISFTSFFGQLCAMQHVASAGALAHAQEDAAMPAVVIAHDAAEGTAPIQADVAQCPICLEPITNPHELVHGDQLFGCDTHHVWHAACIAEWMQSQMNRNQIATCPICRAQLLQQLPETISANVRIASPFYYTQVIQAANNNYELLQQAIAAGADIEILLLVAIKLHMLLVANWLITHDADIHETLLLAIRTKSTDAIPSLIYDFNANVHAHNEQAIQVAFDEFVNEPSQIRNEIVAFLCATGGRQTMCRALRLICNLAARGTWTSIRNKPITSLVIGAGIVATGAWIANKLIRRFRRR